MARCGCASTTCSCAVQGGVGVVVQGVGTVNRPYTINIDAGKITVDDTPTLDLRLTGSGSSPDPYHLSGVVTAKLDDLTDVTSPTPAQGQVLAYDLASQQWKPTAPVTATPGAINAGNGITGDGSAATPLTARANAAAGIVVDGNGIGLQSGILDRLKDSGWLTTGWVKSSGASDITGCRVRMVGKRVTIIASGHLAAAVPASATGDYGNVSLFVVPAGFAPTYTQGLRANLTGPNFCYGVGSSTGQVVLSAGPSGVAIPAGQAWTLSDTYLID